MDAAFGDLKFRFFSIPRDIIRFVAFEYLIPTLPRRGKFKMPVDKSLRASNNEPVSIRRFRMFELFFRGQIGAFRDRAEVTIGHTKL